MSRVRFPVMVCVSALVLCGGELATSRLVAQATSPRQQQPAAAGEANDSVSRGQYIVEEVAQCGRCHTPVDGSSGERDRFRKLQGGPLDVAPTIAAQNWAIAAPRLAGMPPGTDEEFVRLMMTGISRTGARPKRPMPQFHMSQADAEAVLAYLKSLPAR